MGTKRKPSTAHKHAANVTMMAKTMVTKAMVAKAMVEKVIRNAKTRKTSATMLIATTKRKPSTAHKHAANVAMMAMMMAMMATTAKTMVTKTMEARAMVA